MSGLLSSSSCCCAVLIFDIYRSRWSHQEWVDATLNKLVFLRTQQTLYSAKTAGQRHRTDTEPFHYSHDCKPTLQPELEETFNVLFF